MKRGRQDTIGQQARRPRNRAPLPAHPLFAAVLGLWGAALGGLVTLVLPRAEVAIAAGNAGLESLGENAPFVLAGIVACVLGGILFVLGAVLSRKARRARANTDNPSIAALAVRHVRTIDPARELGSRSLDEPVETLPFTSVAPAPEAEVAPETAKATPADAGLDPPRALDLAQFAALPGRNAVWVEESRAPAMAPEAEPETAPEPAATPLAAIAPAGQQDGIPVPLAVPPLPRPVSQSAVERLRAVPPGELSLVQLVERFAAALHEHQSAPSDRIGRDAALAEALKALAALTGEDGAEQQGEPLRAALTRLQELRGAA